MTTKQINKELDKLRKLRQKAYTKMQDTPKAKRRLKCKRVLIYHAQQLSIVSLLLEQLLLDHPEISEEIKRSELTLDSVISFLPKAL